MAVNIWPAVSWIIDRIPVERMFNPPRDHKKEMEELRDILVPTAKSKTTVTEEKPAPAVEPPSGLIPVSTRRVHLEPKPASISAVSTAETVAYQNREIGKVLLQMERHAAQKFTIAGKKCDCGQSRHLLDLESLAEETLSMVDNPDIYNRIIDYVKDVGPKVTVEALNTGMYDGEFPSFVTRARSLRKELIGTLDAHALFPKKEGSVEQVEAGTPAGAASNEVSEMREDTN